MKLRKWQKEALDIYLKENKQDFTLTATPGAGKTTFALTLAKILMKEKKITRIIIVCPTDHLRTQWADAAQKEGILLDRSVTNSKKVKPNTKGYVTTYAQVAAKPILHERRTELPHKTFVIFDEIHHAGDGLSWGEAIREAFTPAVRRLHLTGTPFRTSPHEKIPFVTYEEQKVSLKDKHFSGNIFHESEHMERTNQVASLIEGDKVLVSSSDYTYGYGEALRDEVVRPVIFAAYSGTSKWINEEGEILTAELGQNLTKKDQHTAWKAALNPEGKWVESVIKAANQRLNEIRSTPKSHDAGCLILASDQSTAKAYADIVKQVTGEKPAVVLSDDVHASKRIATFSEGTAKFIIAVRMVSEGVDIPRLRVLVWLTSYQTPLFFAQAVGRVIRMRQTKETATVFLPTVPSLLLYASNMETERKHYMWKKKFNEGIFDDNENPYEGAGVGLKPEFLASEAKFGHILVGGKAITPQVSQPSGNIPSPNDIDTEKHHTGGKMSPVQEVNHNPILGLPGLLTPEQEALILAEEELKSITTEKRSQGETLRHDADNGTKLSDIEGEEEKQRLLSEINFLSKKVSRRTGEPLQKVRKDLNQVGETGIKTNDVNLQTLKLRRDWLLKKTLP